VGWTLRVVHLYKDYFPPVEGGAERTVSRMAQGAARAGATVTVLTSAHGARRTSEETIDGVRVIRCAEWGRALSTPICPGMPARLARIDADLLHLHVPSPPGEVSALLTKRSVPMVATYHGDIVRQAAMMPVYGFVLGAILDRARVIMPTSPQYIERSRVLNARRDKCTVLPLGIELDRFTSPGPADRRAAELRSMHGTPLVLFVGRFRYYKGLDVLMRAMPSVRGRLVLVGEGPEEQRLRAMQAEFGLGDRVQFAGSVTDDEVLAYYRAADVFVLPSTHPSEAFGLVMVEAQASGRPVVCTELGTGTSFVTAHGETGFVVPPADPGALAAAINRLLDDAVLRSRMGEAGRQRALALFSAERMVSALLGVYESVLGPSRSAALARAAGVP
jgi:rhamnosyl/mannosyltransferase